MNWQGRATVCDNIAAHWKGSGAEVKMFQIMGQDSFEEKTAQEALRLKHVRDNLRRTLLIFPREGSRKTIDVPRELIRHVEVVEGYHDALKFSSTKARTGLSQGETPEAVHPAIVELVRSKGMYPRIACSKEYFFILVIGAPAIGKGALLTFVILLSLIVYLGTLSAIISEKYKTSRFSAGDFYRACLV
jgi:hypothetical protein